MEPRSIRDPNTGPRDIRSAPGLPPAPPAASGPAAASGPTAARPRPRPALETRAPKARPDPNPLRLMLGFAGVATASAFTAAMIPSVAPAQDAAAVADPNANTAAVVQPEPSVLHVTKFVTLQPGQVAPPQSTVIVRPQPTPIVRTKVVVRTRQSGKP
jgi:hypothetical protein